MQPDYRTWVAGGTHLELGGYRIFHRRDGPIDGRPVTLLHGYPTSSHDWVAVLPALTESGCRVTTLDFLGFGASDKPRDHEYRITEQAGLVEQLWEQLEIGETALVAHDYGVSVAQELLARDSARVLQTAWLNGGLYPDLYRPLPIQHLMISRAGKIVNPLMSEWAFRLSLRRILGRPVADADLHQMWLALSDNGGRRVQWGLNRYHAERRSHAERWRQALESYSGPTLFVWGPADPISGAHLLPRLRERLPNARFEVLDAAPVTGHYPQVENPEAVAAALAQFLGSDRSR